MSSRGYTARALDALMRLLTNGGAEDASSAGLDANEDSSEDEAEYTGEIGDGELCCVCLQRPRNTVFADCGHRACCLRCAKRLTKPLTLQQQLQRASDPSAAANLAPLFACPLCRAPTSRDRVIRIYN